MCLGSWAFTDAMTFCSSSTEVWCWGGVLPGTHARYVSSWFCSKTERQEASILGMCVKEQTNGQHVRVSKP